MVASTCGSGVCEKPSSDLARDGSRHDIHFPLNGDSTTGSRPASSTRGSGHSESVRGFRAACTASRRARPAWAFRSGRGCRPGRRPVRARARRPRSGRRPPVHVPDLVVAAVGQEDGTAIDDPPQVALESCGSGRAGRSPSESAIRVARRPRSAARAMASSASRLPTRTPSPSRRPACRAVAVGRLRSPFRATAADTPLAPGRPARWNHHVVTHAVREERSRPLTVLASEGREIYDGIEAPTTQHLLELA